jgi:hypothetical protein
MTFADRVLSQQLERTEGLSNVDFVLSRATLEPDSGAEWTSFGGTYAMYDGKDSPLTQTFGLGLFESADDRTLASLEDFFLSRSCAVIHEVSPLADPALLTLLVRRGYRPIELSTILFRELEPVTGPATPPSFPVRLIDKTEIEPWARASALGWSSELPSGDSFMLNFARIGACCPANRPFVAELDGAMVATASLSIFATTAILGGASTLLHARNRGAQSALLNARLQFARNSGCQIAMMGALPGSPSQRNAERNGFRVAYTRTKWSLTE